jgi:uncharacterized protein HemY
VPVKFHVKEQPEAFERFGAQWTPTQIVLDPDGKERHRIEGFLPVEDFIAQLGLALGKLAFEHHEYAEAERRFHEVCAAHPSAGAAAEACYWEGVSQYKATNAADRLAATARLLRDRYPESEWARKGSVWLS